MTPIETTRYIFLVFFTVLKAKTALLIAIHTFCDLFIYLFFISKDHYLYKRRRVVFNILSFSNYKFRTKKHYPVFFLLSVCALPKVMSW